MIQKEDNSVTIQEELVMSKIYVIRGLKVMLDKDLADLYGVETKRLNEAVRRNIYRFPEDFMFELTSEEFISLRSHFATLKSGRGQHRKYMPFAFTEQGVAMLSSVLNSETAIRVNIQIIRVFTRMRQLMSSHKDILMQLEKIERKLSKHDEDIIQVFKYLGKLIDPPVTPRNRIGFRRKNEQGR
jgi:hypothetical protein